MREIKFRAFDKRHKRMYYTTPEHTVWAGGAQPSVNSNHGQMPGDWEIMQYTGIKDWYEGDIVKDEFTDIVSIIRFGYSKKTGTIGFYLENRKHSFLHYPLDNEMEGHVRLGNIYEHPELLSPAG